MLLVPNGDLQTNREKLKQALLMGNPLLLAALLPSVSSVPLPTDETEHQCASALSTASTYVVGPEQDPLIRARATGHP